MSKDVEEIKRTHWGTQIEFIFSIVGYTVSLSNFWRFPYLCMRNGGGAFLIPYFCCLLLTGLPLYYLELCIGQFSGCSPIVAWKRICPLFRGLGWSLVMISAVITIYYITIMVWILYYLVKSLTRSLPWSSCDNYWNTPNCTILGVSSEAANSSYLAYSYNSTEGVIQADNGTSVLLSSMGNSTAGHVTAAEEFWRYNVLGMSDGIDNMGGLKWDLVLCLIANWVIVFLCIFKGIKTSGKVVYVTVVLPYVLLTVLLIRGATLPGSLKGVQFYIIPEWSRLLDYQVWTDAGLQVFYSLGTSCGCLTTMSSFNKFRNKCLSDAVIATITCGLSSLYSGFAIFTILGYMAHAAGVEVGDVVTQGPGLAFVAYPKALSALPISPFWAVCFFLTLMCLAIDGEFCMLETVITSIVDEFPILNGKRRVFSAAGICAFMFFLGLPYVTKGGIYLFQISDWYAAAFSCMVVGLCELFVISYIYGLGNIFRDIEMMTDSKPSKIWAFFWAGFTQVFLIVLLVMAAVKMVPPSYGSYTYPGWAIALGWTLAMVSIIPIPIAAVFELAKPNGTFYQRIMKALRPSDKWGPQMEELSTDFYYSRSEQGWKDRMALESGTKPFIISSQENQPLDGEVVIVKTM